VPTVVYLAENQFILPLPLPAELISHCVGCTSGSLKLSGAKEMIVVMTKIFGRCRKRQTEPIDFSPMPSIAVKIALGRSGFSLAIARLIIPREQLINIQYCGGS